MSSTLIQQSLIDIEQNLKKLESARSQVGNMADKSEQLITSVASVIESIEAIKNSFSNEENYLKNSVHDSLEEFSQTLSKGAESANKKGSEIALKQEEVVNRTITKMEEFQTNLSDIQKSILDFDLEKSLDKITTEVSGLSELIASNQTATSQELEEIKSKLEEHKTQHEKSSKLNLIILAAGFILTFAIILITK